jgi:hypothetical protein
VPSFSLGYVKKFYHQEVHTGNGDWGMTGLTTKATLNAKGAFAKLMLGFQGVTFV